MVPNRATHHICCIQETKFKEKSVRKISGKQRLSYYGKEMKRDWEEMRKVIDTSRVSDRTIVMLLV